MSKFATGLAAFALASALSFVALMAVATPPASAQQMCLVRDDAAVQLQRQYGEQVHALGVVEDGESIVELFTSANGSWTLLLSNADGHACVIGSGEAWTALAAQAGDPA